MNNYQRINTIAGWLVFAVAAVVYLLTIEPTVSFWDCGEFITSAYKLEVGHPPGAPFFMLLGRFFTMFAFGDVSKVPVMVNIMSALASAFTVLFLFWTITHIARRIVGSNDLSMSQTIAIIGSGIVGGLTYTFSDTFWFSAVEGEVYALSSLFTAIVFWAILKWENVAHEPYANRWIIFIAFLMGISIGVHLLNLLTIPAIVFVYYFRKYKPSLRGIVTTGVLSVVILAVIQYGIITGLVAVGGWFELLFVNSFGMPFNSGIWFYFILIIGAVAGGIFYTYRKGKVLANTILTVFAVILIGYSSFSIIVIRAAAATPMNQNNPDDFFALLGYLNREQYGDRPLGSGQYFNAPLEKYEKGRPNYVPRNGKYEITDYKIDRVYSSQYSTVFPRMYSDQESPNHVQDYLRWLGKSEADFFQPRVDQSGKTMTDRNGNVVYDHSSPQRPPTFGENLRFFFNYQVWHMYLRYFFWNFVGRQNDVQNTLGDVAHGNWLSGIGFIDEWRLGDQDKYPSTLKNNAARNAYFFLPLLLGIAGMVYMVRGKKETRQYFWVVMLFFFFTGLAIVLYLNQTPQQPRERDYAYAGSFYAFAIYVGLGVWALFGWLQRFASHNIIAASVLIVTSAAVPLNMAVQNWDDHDRSNRYMARDFAKNYLESCAPNAVLFTNGDNDTFPLWYAQEVEGVRTDVRVVNLSYLNTDWYIQQAQKQAYNSPPLPISFTFDQYIQGTRDVVYIQDNQSELFDEKFYANRASLQAEYDSLYSQTLKLLEKTEFPKLHPADFETLSKGSQSISPRRFVMMHGNLSERNNIDRYKLNETEIKTLKKGIEQWAIRVSKCHVPIADAVKFVASDEASHKLQPRPGEEYHYLPTSRMRMSVEAQQILKDGVVSPKDASRIVGAVDWTLPGNYVAKNHLMVLDLLATSNWQRPVYFAVTTGPDSYINLQNYFQLDGLAYRVVPIRSQRNDGLIGRVNTDTMYRNMMERFEWGGLDKYKDDMYLDENCLRMVMNIRNNFYRLSEALVQEGKKDSATKVLDFCHRLLPNDFVPYNYYNFLMAQQYTAMDAYEKSDTVLYDLGKLLVENVRYYASLSEKEALKLDDDRNRDIAVLDAAGNLARENAAKRAAKLLADGKKDQALALLDNCMAVFDTKNVELGSSAVALTEMYLKLGVTDKASDIARQLSDLLLYKVSYYMQAASNPQVMREINMMQSDIAKLLQVLRQNNQTDLAQQIETQWMQSLRK